MRSFAVVSAARGGTVDVVELHIRRFVSERRDCLNTAPFSGANVVERLSTMTNCVIVVYNEPRQDAD